MSCAVPQAAQCDLSVLSVDDQRQPEVLLETKFNEAFPTVSPDGRWIAYESDASGRPEVYVRPYPNVQGGQWQVSTAGGTEPLWGRSGGELFYQSVAGLMAVPVATGTAPTLGKPQLLFTLGRFNLSPDRDYDVSPKDDRFILVGANAPGGARIVVVQNWIEELQRLVSTN